MRDFAKDREICEKATPGPWKITPERRLMMALPQVVCDFIEAAREGWPAALQHIAELEQQVENLEGKYAGTDDENGYLQNKNRELEAENARLAFQLEVATVLPANAEAYEDDIRHLREELQRHGQGWMKASAENAALKAEVQRLNEALDAAIKNPVCPNCRYGQHYACGGCSCPRCKADDACACNTCDVCLDRHREE